MWLAGALARQPGSIARHFVVSRQDGGSRGATISTITRPRRCGRRWRRRSCARSTPGNPSSVHARRTRRTRRIEAARDQRRGARRRQGEERRLHERRRRRPTIPSLTPAFRRLGAGGADASPFRRDRASPSVLDGAPVSRRRGGVASRSIPTASSIWPLARGTPCRAGAAVLVSSSSPTTRPASFSRSPRPPGSSMRRAGFSMAMRSRRRGNCRVDLAALGADALTLRPTRSAARRASAR